MNIHLQNMVGEFDASFLQQISLLEQKMIAEGLDPSAFTISKTYAQQPLPYRFGGLSSIFDYTVCVKGKSFTVSKYNDLIFLEYFYNCCFPPEQKENSHSLEHKLEALAGRLVKWLREEPMA